MKPQKRSLNDTLLLSTAIGLGTAISAWAFYIVFNPQGRIVIPREEQKVVRSRHVESPKRVYSQGPYVDQVLESIIRNYQEARIVIGDQGTGIDATAAVSIVNALSEEVRNRYGNQLPPSICKLASECTRIGQSNTYFENAFNHRTIGVGDYANNKWAELIRTTSAVPYESPPAGTGAIHAYGPVRWIVDGVESVGKNSLVITGGTPEDIRRAARVLANHHEYDLHGAVIHVYERNGKIQTEIIR